MTLISLQQAGDQELPRTMKRRRRASGDAASKASWYREERTLATEAGVGRTLISLQQAGDKREY